MSENKKIRILSSEEQANIKGGSQADYNFFYGLGRSIHKFLTKPSWLAIAICGTSNIIC